jgi:hypothetical protein
MHKNMQRNTIGGVFGSRKAALLFLGLTALLGLIAYMGCRSRSGTAIGTETTTNYAGSLTPSQPAEAFDLGSIQSANLDELLWSETNSKVVNGVRIVDGTWSPGAYTGPVADGGSLSTITLKSKARLYAPEQATAALPIIVYANHYAQYVTIAEASFVKIASYLQVALLVHGEYPDDGLAMGYTDPINFRGDMLNAGLTDMIKRNLNAVVDLQTSNFMFALARTNMLAFTLAERLLESAGHTGAKGAMFGVSKEGYAVWLSAAVDDRLVAISPQNFQLLDLAGYDAYEYNSGCGPNGSSSAVNIPSSLYMRDWLRTTAAGKQAAKTALVSEFTDKLLPRFFMIAGDAGMPGIHDGIFFSIGADSAFLSAFTHPVRSFRSIGETGNTALQRLALLANTITAADLNSAIAAWVKIESASADDAGSTVTVRATVSGGSAARRVYVFWNQSPNREFNDTSQTSWSSVELIPDGTGSFSGTLVPVADQEIAWFVQAEDDIDVGGVLITRTDATPISFLRELPKLSCDGNSL